MKRGKRSSVERKMREGEEIRRDELRKEASNKTRAVRGRKESRKQGRKMGLMMEEVR